MLTAVEYNFWCWKSKLFGVVYLLHLLAGCILSEDITNTLLERLRNTDADENEWVVLNINVAPGLWQLIMAYDKDDRDIIHIRVKSPVEFQERIQFLDQIQSSLISTEIEPH